MFSSNLRERLCIYIMDDKHRWLYNHFMDDEHSAPPLKRPRIFVAGADMELEDFREEWRKQDEKILRLEEEKKNMGEEIRNMSEEKEEIQEKIEEELKGLIECPVCLMAPRERGPVPVCSNGHIVCRPCRDRIRQEAREEVA